MVNPDGSVRELLQIGFGALTERLENDGSGLPLFHGFASPGTATSAVGWRIKKFTYTNSVLTLVQWADSNGNFDNVWDDRSGLSYG